jgi:hypothetical protein
MVVMAKLQNRRETNAFSAQEIHCHSRSFNGKIKVAPHCY